MNQTKNLKLALIVLIAIGIAKFSCEIAELKQFKIPNELYLRGHIGYYRQNLTGISKKANFSELLDDCLKLLLRVENDVPGELKFIVTSLEPFLFAINDFEGFTVWGPTYSALKEMAVKGNYR